MCILYAEVKFELILPQKCHYAWPSHMFRFSADKLKTSSTSGSQNDMSMRYVIMLSLVYT